MSVVSNRLINLHIIVVRLVKNNVIVLETGLAVVVIPILIVPNFIAVDEVASLIMRRIHNVCCPSVLGGV